MATHRITKHADNRFAVEVRVDNSSTWRLAGEFQTWRQADAEKTRLEKIAAVPDSDADSDGAR